MNKRQKLVQKQFLDNEQEIINRLHQVYNKSLKDINDKIKNLTFSINDMKLEYSWLDDDDPEKERIKSMIQSKIYQKQYQEQLRQQVDGILQRMNIVEFTNINDYLDTCYSDGFIGAVFDMHGQGVPIMSPIDQEAMVRAVQLESKISKGLYTRLGEDVGLLKKKITAQVSRSIASGMTYAQTAKAIEGYTRIGYNNAIRIARTEGHRVQTTATMDAMEKAKERGADILKQWDATLDGRTRESHSQVDGEFREMNEPFSNGLMYPGDPSGSAAEVVNCRCALLQRARWALGDEFTKVNGFTNQIESFDSPESYDEFKKAFFSPENKRYMEYTERMQDKYGTKDFAKVLDKMSENEYNKYGKLLKNNPVYNKNAVVDDIIAFKHASTIEEAKDFVLDGLGLDDATAYDLGINIDVANALNEAVFKISSEIGSLAEYGYLKDINLLTSNNEAYARYSKSLATVFLNKKVKRKNAISLLKKDALEQFELGAWSSDSPFHSIYHELGHAVEHMISDNYAPLRNKIDVLYSKTYDEIMGKNTIWKNKGDGVFELAKKAKDAGLSYYGMRNSGEFISEAIAQYYCSDKPSDLTKKIIQILKGG